VIWQPSLVLPAIVLNWSNGLTSATLKPGTSLAIPPIDGIVYTVKAGDTADTLASKYSANKDQITAFNDAEVTGLKVNDRIVIPGGSIAPPPVTTSYYTGFAAATAVYGGNGYDYGWCTWYVSNRRAELGRPVPNNLGNAYSWYVIAQREGLPTGSAPQVGAVAVNQGGNHVSVVEQLNDDGSFWISEMNASGQVSITDSRGAGGWGRIDFRLVPSAGSLKFIY
jgi:surface antigen